MEGALGAEGLRIAGDPREGERKKYPTATLTPRGERILGARAWPQEEGDGAAGP